MANASHVVEADYVGIVSANAVPDKLERAGLHPIPSAFVDAPLIAELPMALECTMIQYDEESERMIGKIVNVSADDSVLGEDGRIDPEKLQPITFDPIHHTYRKLGECIGFAFQDGKKLQK